MSRSLACRVTLDHPRLVIGVLELTDPVVAAKTISVQAKDLQQAQRESRRLLQEFRAKFEEPASAMLDITVHVAESARAARRQISEAVSTISDGVTYVGTAAGLAGLIADIGIAGVADGVTLRPAIPDSVTMLTLLAHDVVPLLDRRGIRTRPDAVAQIRNLTERVRTPCSTIAIAV